MFISSFLAFLAANCLFFILSISGGSFPNPLSAKEEREYLERLANGDNEARNILIERNLRLVAHIAKKYTPKGCDSDDIISIGTIGLIKGVTSFKGEKGTRLATYAARCIENEILMYMRGSKKLQGEISIDESIGSDREGNEISLMDILEDGGARVDELVDLKLMSGTLYEKMKEVLSPVEREILIMRYGLDNLPVRTQSK